MEWGRPKRWSNPPSGRLFPSLRAFEQARRTSLRNKNPPHSRWIAPSFVGTTGFEPATPCTPCKCATGLRYVPNVLILLIQRVAKVVKKSARAVSGGLTFFYDRFLKYLA